MNNPDHIVANPWAALRKLTQARIALGRSGVSLPTDAQLAFQAAHANARDAVHAALDGAALAAALADALGPLGLGCLQLDSACPDRATYLQRPDLGRQLAPASSASLVAAPCDLALVIADGLSALAVQQNALPFLSLLLPRLAQDGWTVGPLAIVRQRRVAVGDEIGARLGARAVVVLIGERPGLSSPDSMGLYLTWAPHVGKTDAERNCISNVRPAGLAVDEAAYRLHYLLGEARRRELSGVALKDDTDAGAGGANALAGAPAGAANFLLR